MLRRLNDALGQIELESNLAILLNTRTPPAKPGTAAALGGMLSVASAPAWAHGPSIEFFYLLAALYFLPFLIGYWVTLPGTRRKYFALAALALILGWVLLLAGGHGPNFFALATVAYMLPWLLVPAAAILRSRQRRVG